jgi:membrane protein involved in colicin uptake
MSIRPVDIQTNVTGTRSASDFRQHQQNIEHLHQNNPHGAEIEKKTLSEVNETENQNKVKDEDEKEEQKKKKEQSEEEKKKATEDKAKEETKTRPGDGIRGRRLDFSV